MNFILNCIIVNPNANWFCYATERLPQNSMLRLLAVRNGACIFTMDRACDRFLAQIAFCFGNLIKYTHLVPPLIFNPFMSL